MSTLLFALLGIAVGSFLNVCIDRLPNGGSIISPPSKCDTCGRRLKALDLIPVVSFLLRRGRCRYCKAQIPPRCLWVELGTGVLFGLIWLRFPSSTYAGFVACCSAILIVILVIDLEHQKIFNRVVYPAIGFALIFALIYPEPTLGERLLGGLLGSGLLFLLAIIYPTGMGMGDVKLMGFIGLVVGFPYVILALFLSFVLGGLISGVLLMAGRIGRRDPIAFAPFLALGALTTLFYGEQIVRWWSR
ncbi:MAG: prepilin peptidase [Anaerolineales bacterium]|jgi:leader peptidase (prepilin peptidase)/N-methyltransferase